MDVTTWFVTGASGAGKTTLCEGLIREARRLGWDAAGLLSPAVFEEGQKKSIDAVSVRTGERRLLASTLRQAEADLSFGDWFFNQETFSWGNRVIQDSLPCDLLVLDELGPLEFYFSKGWTSALEALHSTRFRLALTVIRPELIKDAAQQIHAERTIWLQDRSDVPAALQSCLPWLEQWK